MKTPAFWRTTNAVSLILSPFSLLYRAGARLDRAMAAPQKAPAPVISLGNVTAGGAGKTPATLALVPLLRSLGYTPHVLTRGYRGEELLAQPVQPSDDWRRVGDEALLLQRAAPTWVGARRVASAQAAVKAGADMLLCDDALQHHALQKDLSLLVIDGPFGIGNGLLLPAGPLREPLEDVQKRIDAVILVGADMQQLAARFSVPVFRAQLAPVGDVGFLAGKRWLAFAGIGRPDKFYDSLRALGADVVATRDFADHYAYSAGDVEGLQAEAARLDAQLITTEKDSVKIPSAIATLPVRLAFEDEPALCRWLKQRLDGLRTP